MSTDSAASDSFAVAAEAFGPMAIIGPIVIFCIMMAMGMDLTPNDFHRIVRFPRAVLMGLLGQLVLLPLVAWGIAMLLPLRGEVATGMLILAACPGGPASNVVVFIARGDTALSITLTGTSNLITVFTIPAIVGLAAHLFLAEDSSVSLPYVATVLQILFLIAVPVGCGMLIRGFFPVFAQRSYKYIQRIAITIFLLAVIGQIGAGPGNLLPAMGDSWLPALLLLASAFTIGIGLGRLARLSPQQTFTLGTEVGIQNVALSHLISTVLLGRLDLAAFTFVYAPFCGLAVAVSILAFRRYQKRSQQRRSAGEQDEAVQEPIVGV